MRSLAIEIEIDKSLIPDNIKQELDIEFSSKRNCWVLWIHSTGFKPFKKEHFQYINAALNAFNRTTGTDHLNLFIETSNELKEHDKEIEGIKYENIKFSELKNKDLTKVKLNKEL